MMNKMQRRVFPWAMMALSLTAPVWSVQAAEFIPLGFLPGGVYSRATAVSGDGSVVVGVNGVPTGAYPDVYEAFRWTRGGGMTGLGDLPGGTFFSLATGVSRDGGVVAGYSLAGPSLYEGFRWTPGHGLQSLGRLPSGTIGQFPTGVAGNGQAIVGYLQLGSGVHEAFRWTATSGTVGLGDLPGGGSYSIAQGTSDDGRVVVGGGTTASGGRAFRWVEGSGMQDIGTLPGGNFSWAYGVSPDGTQVVGESTTATTREAFLWHEGATMLALGDLAGGAVESVAYGVSADGTLVVGRGTSDAGEEAFLWSPTNGMRSLMDVLITDYGLGGQLTGWHLTRATAISPDGFSIVGYGRNPFGWTEAWLVRLHPVPLPAAVYLFGVGLAALGTLGCRSRVC